MDFLAEKPHEVGNVLPANLRFEVDDIKAQWDFELWDVKKEICHGKLAEQSRKGCYVTVQLGEQFACLGAGTYTIKVLKECIECKCVDIHMSYDCKASLVDSESIKQECEFCE